MSKLNTFSGERLKSARIYRGYTLTELSENTGISKQSLSLYENNKNKPEWDNVLKISGELDFPREFFFQKNKYDVNTDTTYFRAILSANKKDRIAQSIKLEFLAQIYLFLCEYVDFPSLNVPKIEFTPVNTTDICISDEQINNEQEQIERIARRVRECWNLGDGPIMDLRYILESNGIIVTCFDAKASKIDAFSQRTTVNDGEIYIVVVSNSGQSVVRSRFDMAHELGHILLHPWSEDIESITREEFKARERQANMFAGAFMLPEDTFKQDVSYYPTKPDYYLHLKQKWNVSISAMIYRAHQLKVITDNQYQYLMRQISKNGWRECEPGDVPYSLENNMLQSAVELLIQTDAFSGMEFVMNLSKNGITMHPHEIEELLCLKNGTLSRGQNSQSQIVQLKNLNED